MTPLEAYLKKFHISVDSTGDLVWRGQRLDGASLSGVRQETRREKGTFCKWVNLYHNPAMKSGRSVSRRVYDFPDEAYDDRHTSMTHLIYIDTIPIEWEE